MDAVNAPGIGPMSPEPCCPICMYPVGMILTSKISPSTSTEYSVGIALKSSSLELPIWTSGNASSSSSPLRNCLATGGNIARVSTSSSFLMIPKSSPSFLKFSYSGSIKSAGLQVIGSSSPIIFLAIS